MPVLFMTLLKPGKTGPGLRLHKDGPACTVVAAPANVETATIDMVPCHVYQAFNRQDHSMLAVSRDTTVQLMAAFFSNIGHLRTIVDQTGLTGTIDFSMVFTPEPPHSASPLTTNAEDDPSGTTFTDAIRNQLGLKLAPGRASIPIPVVDHLEMPTEN